ncbi:MAG: hypothetical protein Ta2G_21280 [Termitinemataceae bacterium]|nr:MAG: hypothetical protein Ta2G_21280 [Termitinemataceae bacterium]
MTVYEDLVVRNSEDVSDFRRGRIKETEVRQTTARFKADRGMRRNVISKDVFERLGLRKKGEQTFMPEDGQRVRDEHLNELEYMDGMTNSTTDLTDKAEIIRSVR